MTVATWLSSVAAPFKSGAVPTPIERTKNGARLVSDPVVNMIIKFEKLHRVAKDGLVYPYHDMIGLPTIGVGHLLSMVKGEDLSKYPPITVDEAYALKRHDLDKFSIGIERQLPGVILNDNEFGALVSLSFNIGLGNFKASTLRKKLLRGDSRDEIALEFLKWDKAGGMKVRGLTIRRTNEMHLFLT